MHRPSIAVLGGGLTGLSSAFYLSRRYPEALITVYEKSPRFGGWVHSERIDVTPPDGGSAQVLLESGPRTLRPNAKAVLELINLLGLKESLVTTPKTSPAAKNRFLQLPEVQPHGIVSLPTSIPALLSSPLRDHLLWNVLRESLKCGNRPSGVNDESFDEFIGRRFGGSFARKFGSALVHGIYAADSRKLSVRAAFPSLWEAEERGWGSVIRGLLVPNTQRSRPIDDDYEAGDITKLMESVSVFSFKDGMSTITDTLVEYLKQRQHVRLLPNTGVETLAVLDGGIQVSLTNVLHEASSSSTDQNYGRQRRPSKFCGVNPSPSRVGFHCTTCRIVTLLNCQPLLIGSCHKYYLSTGSGPTTNSSTWFRLSDSSSFLRLFRTELRNPWGCIRLLCSILSGHARASSIANHEINRDDGWPVSYHTAAYVARQRNEASGYPSWI
ncbi:hypothetical protein E1B28_005763 [Marasmius oreades]|uniref:Protoporphyrinogen oxidase n=1 Tax=Marasmius oreades TaxID=181124 RepID=A0A9P7S455_9AGAR|nr:uncharacterized protein E1B28_005763 [Marasmius oreades]KAG7094962.1 hypothetical protein E1B28_005763 [Marasmius oreades]